MLSFSVIFHCIKPAGLDSMPESKGGGMRQDSKSQQPTLKDSAGGSDHANKNLKPVMERVRETDSLLDCLSRLLET